MDQSTAKRYVAKVANVDARGIRWEKGDEQTLGAEDAKVLSHHWEELGKAQDGSDDPEIKKQLAQQEKLDHLKQIKARDTYDEVRPEIAGGAAVAVDRTPEEAQKLLADRKAEEKANDERKAKGTTGRQAVVVEGDRVVVEAPKPVAAAPSGPARLNVNAPVDRVGNPIANRPGVNVPPSTAGQPSGRPVMPNKPGNK